MIFPQGMGRSINMSASGTLRVAARSAVVLGLFSATSHGSNVLVTMDPAQVSAFQNGATVLGFDELPPNGGGNTGGNTGIAIDPASQVTDQYADLGVLISSTGGPAAVVSNGFDPKSPPNLIGGSVDVGGIPRLSYLEPIDLKFTGSGGTSRVGAWNDPTGSRIRLSVFNAAGALVNSVEADQGSFVGVEASGIASASFEWVRTESVAGFSLDDVTFIAAGAPPPPPSGIPLPPGAWPGAAMLAGMSGIYVLRARRRRME
jgi:hypothetical protein